MSLAKESAEYIGNGYNSGGGGENIFKLGHLPIA